MFGLLVAGGLGGRGRIGGRWEGGRGDKVSRNGRGCVRGRGTHVESQFDAMDLSQFNPGEDQQYKST